MSTAPHDSRLDLAEPPRHSAAVARARAVASGSTEPSRPGERFWLNGGVVACACPDCRAPMTVRLWLMTADCWRCGTSIDLSLEEERQIRRLLRKSSRPSAPAAPDTTPAPRPHAPTKPRPATRPITRPARPRPSPLAKPRQPRPAPKPILIPPLPAPAHAYEPQQVVGPPEVETRRRDWLRELIACLASLIFHMLLIILLGMWNLSDDNASDSLRLVLSTAIGPEHKEGEKSRDEAPVDEAEFELPASATPEEREELREADRVARELRLGPSEGAEFLPRLSKVKSDLRSSDPYRRMLAARDPRIRAEVVRREGGTTLTEAAVARSLRWMAAHQNADGSWSLHAFDHSPQCRGRCRGAGRVVSDAGGTALVLQAMFAAGQTPDVGIHRETVRHGLDWLLENQRPNGDLSAGSRGNTPMYVHGQATIALAEAYAVVGSSLEEPTRRALEFLCDAQHRQGGWRYNPRQAGDLSVTGWQLMALHTGRACGFKPPRITMLGASHFLDRVQSDREGGLYCYRPRENHSPAMTAEGLLSRMYLGWDRRDPGLEKGVNYLIENHLPDAERPNIYYWYYATQVMHHWGGEPWEVWNRHMQAALPPLQEQHGHEAGSWYFDTNHGRQGGSLYATALATYTLEVYYRHGRLFDRLDLH